MCQKFSEQKLMMIEKKIEPYQFKNEDYNFVTKYLKDNFHFVEDEI